MTTPPCPRCRSPLTVYHNAQVHCTAYPCSYGHDAPRELIPQPDAIGVANTILADIKRHVEGQTEGPLGFIARRIAEFEALAAHPAPTPQRADAGGVDREAFMSGADEAERQLRHGDQFIAELAIAKAKAYQIGYALGKASAQSAPTSAPPTATSPAPARVSAGLSAEAKGSGWVACSERMPPVCRSTHMGNDASAEVVTVGPCGMCGMVYVEYVSNEGGLPGEWYVVDPDGSMDRTGEKYTPTHWLAVPPLTIPPGVGT